jgi:hypothetical protein
LNELDAHLARLEKTLEAALERLASLQRHAGTVVPAQSIPPQSTPTQSTNAEDRRQYVTREELRTCLKRTEGRVETRMAEQFGHQMQAIGSLRAMIADTDILLERVLSRLEASAEDDHTGNDWAEPAPAAPSPNDIPHEDMPDDEPLFDRESLRRAGQKPVSTSAR